VKKTILFVGALALLGCGESSSTNADRSVHGGGGRDARTLLPSSDARRLPDDGSDGKDGSDHGNPSHDSGSNDGAGVCGGTGDAAPPLGPKDAALPPRDVSADVENDHRPDAIADAQSPRCGALALKLLTAGLKNPVYATAPAGDDRIFVLERLAGRIVIVDGSGIRGNAFLDVSARMSGTGFEAGLLSLVFHPNFATNHVFYVSYTTPGKTLRVSRFTVPAATPDVADPASESIVIETPQVTHHNTGGMLLFGPDGFLFVATGDDDYEGFGQNLGVLQAKLLRIAVDPATLGYKVPPDNPFIGISGALPEIWAYGLREPYRFWFDGQAGDLYVADVGEDQREEIDIVPSGAKGGQNFGWSTMEGSGCHTPPSGCQKAGLQVPAYEYPHSGENAVIGGSVYRGTALSACYRGRYFFGDYPTGSIRSAEWNSGVVDVRDEPGLLAPNFVSFGQDGHGEILVLGYDQTLHRIVPGP
jgi:glucose/arabinose dehydrogenase